MWKRAESQNCYAKKPGFITEGGEMEVKRKRVGFCSFNSVEGRDKASKQQEIADLMKLMC